MAMQGRGTGSSDEIEVDPVGLDDGGRSAQVRRLRVGVAALAALAVVVGLAVVVVGDDDPAARVRTDEDARTPDEPGGPRTPEAAEGGSARAILGALPSSPIDGKESWRLPVIAQPQTDLDDGDTVTVYGRGWAPHEYLGIVQCSSEADTSGAGAEGCELSSPDGQTFDGVTYANADADGNVVAEVVVRRSITTPLGGPIDCTSAAERCLIGIGAVSDYDKSGGAYIGFAGAPPFAEPTAALDPAGPIDPGQQVVARYGGLVPLRSLRISQCIEDRCQKLVDAKAGVDGTVEQSLALQPAIVDDATGGAPIPCDDRCVLRADGIGVKGGSAAPLPADLSLSFTGAEPSSPVTMAPTTSTTTTTPPSSPVEPPEGGGEDGPPGEEPGVVDPTTSIPATTPTTGLGRDD